MFSPILGKKALRIKVNRPVADDDYTDGRATYKHQILHYNYGKKID